MNNKEFQFALGFFYNPSFKERVNNLKAQLGQGQQVVIIFNDYLVALANTCIALNFDSPDFSIFRKEFEIHLYGNDDVSDDQRNYLSNFIDAVWELVKEYYPINKFGFPSLGLWEWLAESIIEEKIPVPKRSNYPVYYDFDPDHIKLRAENIVLKCLLREQGIDPNKVLKERKFDVALDGISEILSLKPRLFIEVIPGHTPSTEFSKIKNVVEIYLDAIEDKLEEHRIPRDFEFKVKNIFAPRQFHGNSFEEIRSSYPDDSMTVKELGNISRVYKEVAKKLGYGTVKIEKK